MGKTLHAAALIAALLAFATPMELGDTWWQMASGRWIIEHGELPSADPFALTSTSPHAAIVLKGAWISQLALYTAEVAGGLAGVVALKAAAFTLAIAILLYGMRGAGSATALGLAALAAWAATYYAEARPQALALPLYSTLLVYLESWRRGTLAPMGRARAMLLPALMILWANTYQGYTIGFTIISLYLAGHLWDAFGPRRNPLDRGFLLSAVAALAASALNPNGLTPLLITFGIAATSVGGHAPIHEHLGAGAFAEMTDSHGLTILLIAIAIAAAYSLARNFRSAGIAPLGITAGLGILSIFTYRAGLYFAIAGAYYAALNMPRLGPPMSEKLKKAAGTIAIIALAALCVAILLPRSILRHEVTYKGIIPDKLAAFVKGGGAPANIFHPYEWGGYLIWALQPEYRVFIDGRALGPLDEYFEVVDAGPGWREILDRHKVNTVAFWPILPYKDVAPPIVLALLADKGWSPVYWDSMCLAFVRTGLATSTMRRSAAWELLMARVQANLTIEPENPVHHAALGQIYAARGFTIDARRAFESALKLDPNEPLALDGLARLGQGR
jgi:hypothetical protein